MPPSDVERSNPMYIAGLDAGAQALGGVARIPRETTGIILGCTGLGWLPDTGLRVRLEDLCQAARESPRFASLPAELRESALDAARRALDARLNPASEDFVTQGGASVIAGRLAMHFDLRGLHYAIDAGFASSLAALDAGVRALRDGTLDLVLVGGVSEILSPLEVVCFSKFGGLSQGRVAPFDAAADGTLLGEGAAMFALKRLEDALRDGETIHALVRGVGGSSDGEGRGILVPQAEGQALALRTAYRNADVDPRTVGFVECHGTGIPTSDVTEVRALAAVYGRGTGDRTALGSVTPWTGHLRGGAGAAGMLRAVLALKNRLIPQQINFERPSPALELATTPFFVPTTAKRFDGLDGAPPRAAVTSIGLGGNNFHAVLEAWEPERPRPSRSPVRAAPEPVAIVGMGGTFPGAGNVSALWQSLLDGRDAVQEIPPERWDADRYHDPDPSRNDTAYTKLGCFLDGEPEIESAWRIPPRSRDAIERSHLVTLRAAEEALRDADFTPGRWDNDRVLVALGSVPCPGGKCRAELRIHAREFGGVLETALRQAGVDDAAARQITAEVEAHATAGVPAITEDTLPGYLGSINAARITRRFDFHGPHFAIESMCASTHAALHAAVQALRHGVCDVAVVGGTWTDLSPELYVACCRFQALSARGITPFADGSDGYIPGEGAGVFVLRRLSDAERAGEQIHAVLRAVAGSSDGRGRSVLAPSAEGEALAMRRALDAARVAGSTVDYVECHGSGTALGDAVEVEACLMAYGEERSAPLKIGSVKSNIGHLHGGAGAPALLKTVLALREGVIPPSLKAERLNPRIVEARERIEVVRTRSEWRTTTERPRRAAVNGFGVGGTNFSLIVEEHRPQPDTRTVGSITADTPLDIVTASGRDLDACLDRLRAVARAGAAEGSFAAAVVAAQQQAAGSTEGVRVAIVAPNAEALARRLRLLEAAASQGKDRLRALHAQGIFVGTPAAPPRTALVFAGQGGQYANMLREAAARFPVVRETLDAADRAHRSACGHAISPVFLVEHEHEFNPGHEEMHCAVFTVSVAIYRLLTSYGVRFESVMGQSAGELAALVAAGVLSLEDGVRAIHERTRAVVSLDLDDPGRMVVLRCSADAATGLMSALDGYCTVAADNTDSACIVSGETRTMRDLVARCALAGVEATELAVSHAYHSQMIAGARPRYEAALKELTFSAPRCEVISSITGTSLRHLAPEEYPGYVASIYVRPVRLRHAVRTLHETGTRLFVECGAKWPLTSFITQILDGEDHQGQATLHPKVGEVEQLQRALACLFVHGLCDLQPRDISRGVDMKNVLSINDTNHSSNGARNGHALMWAEGARHAPAQPDVVTLLGSIQELIGAFLRSQEGRGEVASWTAPSAPAPRLTDGTSPPGRPQTPAVTPPPAAPSAVAAPATQPLRERIERTLVAAIVAKTGYPESMLDPDLDLEADLGIDTVKQVAISAEVRESFGLRPEPKARIRDYNTIRKLADYFTTRLESTGSGTVVQPGGAPAKRAEEPLPTDPVKMVCAVFERAWNKGELAVVDRLFAPEFVFHDPSTPKPVRGPGDVRQMIQTYRAAFPDLHVTVHEAIAAGDRVITRWTYRGTHRGDLPGLPASQRAMEISGMQISRVAGGQIREAWCNWDTLGMLQQLGALPPNS